MLYVQALYVTGGPYEGRICENDDDEFLAVSHFDGWELESYEQAGIVWETQDFSKEEIEEGCEAFLGARCEVVSFGLYPYCREDVWIPHQFLRPATMKDLIERYEELSQRLFAYTSKDLDPEERVDLLQEQILVLSEISERDTLARTSGGKSQNVFLCHASEDKAYVRRVHADLISAGHMSWLDEFEIKVGESIVQKINEATSNVEFLVLFLSKNSIKSSWIQREWHSVAMRSISKGKINILPIVIEEVEVPSLLSDIKYADFKNSYRDGLDQLLQALKGSD